jgi:hypothetical protein
MCKASVVPADLVRLPVEGVRDKHPQSSCSLAGNGRGIPGGYDSESNMLWSANIIQIHLVGAHVWVFVVRRFNISFSVCSCVDGNKLWTLLLCFRHLQSHLALAASEPAKYKLSPFA